MTGYRYQHLVTFAETNLVGNVYFTRYLEWQGQCRESFLYEHARQTLDAVRSGALALVTASCEMDFYEECFALDEVEVVMRLHGLSPHRIRMDFDYCRRGVQVARGAQTVACMRRIDDRLEPAPLPADLAQAAGRFS